MFLILIDAYFKWPEVHIMTNITAKSTIEKCKQIFAAFGLPRTIVTDNGRTFISHDFQQFLKLNDIRHKLTSPYNPATNGQAERFVQTLKRSLQRMNCNPTNVNLALSKLLLQYRSMSHALTNKSPAEMFLGRQLYTRLDLIRPTQENTKENTANQNTTNKSFVNEERVACRNYLGQEKRKFGFVKKLGKLHYKVKLDDGRSWIRHVNQIRGIGENTPIVNNSQNNNFYWNIPETNDKNQDIDPQAENAQPPNKVQIDAPAISQAEQCQEAEPIQQTPRRSTRPKRKPKYLTEFVAK